MGQRVVITGMGIVTCLGRGTDETARAFKEEKPGIKQLTTFDVSRHRTSQGGEVSEDDLKRSDTIGAASRYWDRSSRLLYEAVFQACEGVGLPGRDGLWRVPIFAGTTLGGMLASQAFHRAILKGEDRKALMPGMSDALACHQLKHVAMAMGIAGETLIINNACASGLAAIGTAFERLKHGDGDIAIAGGYEAMSEFTHAGFNVLQLVTSDACRPFDQERSGLVLGEGAGVVVMETLQRAKSRNAAIIAEIIGYGQSSDAYHLTKPDPQGNGAARAIKMALSGAGISAGEIDYVNAHGTGTPSNDGAESAALLNALGPHAGRVPVSSTKPFMGHLLGAAGAVETVVSLIAIQQQMAPPNLNLRHIDPACPINVVRRPLPMAINTVLSNSFGFGGANAAILVKKYHE